MTASLPDPYTQTTGELLRGLEVEVARANAAEGLVAELLAALKAVLAQFESGAFVRNTDSDGCSDWAIKAIEPLRVLAAAQAAIASAESR